MKFILALIFLTTVNATMAEDNAHWVQKRYWERREHQLKNYIRIGEGKGRSLLAGQRRETTLFFGDEVVRHGHYISMLAFEYHLLKKSNGDLSYTTKELYYALKVMERLDLAAEAMYFDKNRKFGTPALNGFFIRDDADNSLIPLYNNEITNISSDYNYELNDPNRGGINEMSQDQYVHLVWGLWNIVNYVDKDATFNGRNLVLWAKIIALRTINYIDRNKWIINNPVTGNPVGRGPDAWGLQHGIIKAVMNTVQTKVPYRFQEAYGTPFYWDFAAAIQIPKFYNQTLFHILGVVGDMWGKDTFELSANQYALWPNENFWPWQEVYLLSYSYVHKENVNKTPYLAKNRIAGILSKNPSLDDSHVEYTELLLQAMIHYIPKSIPDFKMPQNIKDEINRQEKL